MEMKPGEPRHLSDSDHCGDFDCGAPSLNDWLKRRARQNELNGASRTYVSCAGERVVAYYALSTGAVTNADAPGNIRRNMPDPIPIILLGRLAVDKACHGRGLGAALLQDAIERTLAASRIVGARALLVHAKDEGAARFYQHFGFVPSPMSRLLLMQRIAAS